MEEKLTTDFVTRRKILPWLGGVDNWLDVGKSEGIEPVMARLTAEKAVVLNWQIKTDNLTEDRVRNELRKRHPIQRQF